MRLFKTAFTIFFAITLASCYADNTQNLTTEIENELTFCITGDSRGHDQGINKKILLKLVEAIKKEKPAFVAVDGDLVTGYSSKLEGQLINWRDTFMAPLLDAGIKVYPCRGNHDAGGSKMKKILKIGKKLPLESWQKVFSGKFALPENGPTGAKGVTYFIKDRNLLFLVLDAYNAKERHQVDNVWIEKVMQNDKGEKPIHIFALTHEPAFAVHHKDCLASKPKSRDQFLKLFLSNGGVCFFCGHDHLYNHAKVTLPEGEFHQFVCGTAGAPLSKWKGEYADKRVTAVKSNRAFGYMVVKLKGKLATLTMKAWDEKGQLKVVDTFTYTLK